MALIDPPRRRATDRQPWEDHGPPTVEPAIVRHGLLALLERRWDVRVTLVQAGAGFGKSIAVGQALRAGLAQPRGIEAWVSCGTGCTTTSAFTATVSAALEPGGHDHLDDGAPEPSGVIAALSPIDVVLVLDDVDALPAPCIEVVDRLVHDGPSNLHLVLVARRIPRLSLARLRAAGQVVDVGETDLRLTAAEVEALATAVGAPAPSIEVGGWPALVRLAVSAPGGSVTDFLWEEVIGSLDPVQRQVLVALVALGPADATTLEEAIGQTVDPATAAAVPLVSCAGNVLTAHDLWTPYASGLLPEDEATALGRRCLDVLVRRGDLVAAGDLARTLGDVEARDRAAVDLVRATLGSLPTEVAERWRDGSGPGLTRDLLAAAAAHARSVSEPPAEVLDALVAGFRAVDDLDGASVTLALATVVAEANGDLGRLLALSAPARELRAHRGGEPMLRLLVAGVDAAVAALQGDVTAALIALDDDIADIAGRDRPEAIIRFHWHVLLLAGRAADAASVARHGRSHRAIPFTRELEAVARWFDGDPDPLLTSDVDLGPGRFAGLSERDRFDQAVLVANLAASAGRSEALHVASEALARTPVGDAPADAALLATARAALEVAAGHEETAAAVVADLLTAWGDDAVVDTYLRRSPTVPYVLAPELRDRWDDDDADLGPSQVSALDVARLLVDARLGRRPSDLPPSRRVLTALPLPWSVELAAWVAGWGGAEGASLATELFDRLGDPVRAEVATLAARPDLASHLREGVGRLVDALPSRPARDVTIRVLGPLEVDTGDGPSEAPALRRARVRQLLEVLVVERTLTRDRAIDLLWPDFDLDRARPNLRATLTHLQRLLEPDRRPGDAPSFLRTDAEHLRLAPVEGLHVDLWDLDRHLADADAARREGDAAARADALRAGLDLWRARPLPDLDALVDLDGTGAEVARRLVRAALDLGELELVRGSPAAAAHAAARALAADPFDERSHRLALAAAVQGRDRAATEAARAQLHRALDELGTPADPTTEMLLRQASALLRGPVDVDLRDGEPRFSGERRGVVGSRRR